MRKLASDLDRAAKILVMVILTVLFIFIALFFNTKVAGSFEGWVYSESIEHMSPAVTLCAKVITHLGDTLAVLLVCLFLLIVPTLRKNYAAPVIASTVLAASLNALLKLAFTRPRPDILRLIAETDFSFPSGHAMINMALYGAIVILAWRFLQTKRMKIAITAGLTILVFAIGFTRVYLGVHYITDVIAGWCLGLAFAVGVILVFDEIKRKSRCNEVGK